MTYSQAEQQAFYRRQIKRLLELVEDCDDARAIAVLLRATVYYMDQIEERAPISIGKGPPTAALH